MHAWFTDISVYICRLDVLWLVRGMVHNVSSIRFYTRQNIENSLLLIYISPFLFQINIAYIRNKDYQY